MSLLRQVALGVAGLVVLGLSGCANPPGKPGPGPEVVNPDSIADFAVLYKANCAGCHGFDGKGGAAIALGDPVYLAVADDAVLRRVATEGVPGTSMPAFAKSKGGMLTEKQVEIIAHGIREKWAKPDVLRGADPPPYAATTAGNSSRGADVYTIFCASCHGIAGKGGKASSIVNGSFLALMSDQELRTIVIVGRPELGAPDWRGNAPGKSMSAQDVSDVVAWLASQRAQFPGEPYPQTDKSTGGTR